MTRFILLVDPDQTHRTRIARSLDPTVGQVMAEATGPEEAMRLAAMTRPDVAIVTTHLENTDDFHLTSRLATEHGIPSILLTRPGDLMVMPHVTQSGVMGLLVRPVDPTTLLAATELAICRFQETLALRREADSLRRLLDSRKLIERAKGLLMELENIPEKEAFARLRQKSMDTQRPMAEIARAVILAAEVRGRSRCHPTIRTPVVR
ncbi:MAG TPA: ANTAR domain-containing protein [archaeon]|nr:ANTAR domain-containing protein [archaeon]